jgi:murein DD-endopeptidase MepM/ murein hydrolase activator NlpD
LRVFDREIPGWLLPDPKLSALVIVASFGAGLGIASLAKAQGMDEPKVKRVVCVTDCDGDAASIGSEIKLRGSGLGLVETVKFTSNEERRVKVEPDDVSDERVKATVPEGAVTGKPRVVDSERRKATARHELEIAGSNGSGTTVPSTPTDPDGTTDPDIPTGSGSPTEPAPQDPPGNNSPDGLSVDPDKGFFKGKRRATAHFTLPAGGSAALDVVSVDDGTTVATLPAEGTGGEASVKWNGVTDAGDVAPNGKYEFRSGSGDSAAFEQYDHIFPINGKHDYGDGIGAGRGHQGQDVFADCGTKLVAARAGKVEFNQSHSAAGNYLVIDGKKTDVDYAYMHMQEPSALQAGDKVRTGQAIGHVGATGNATGCHLHFEMWDGQWQQGGSVMDPAPHLKRWDGWS